MFQEQYLKNYLIGSEIPIEAMSLPVTQKCTSNNKKNCKHGETVICKKCTNKSTTHEEQRIHGVSRVISVTQEKFTTAS